MLFSPEETYGDEVFLVNNPEVLEALGIQAQGRKRYSYRQLQPALKELDRLTRSAFAIEAPDVVNVMLRSLREGLADGGGQIWLVQATNRLERRRALIRIISRLMFCNRKCKPSIRV